MPKNPSTIILRRWQAMDKALHDHLEGLHVLSFALGWKVSTKTVHRDLAAFRELGQLVQRGRTEDGRTIWTYERGVEYLFVRNFSPRVLQAIREVMARR
jgi:hypothetical protein